MSDLAFQAERALWLLSIWALPVVLAVTMHEAAHGWTAARLGDTTARDMGRVTLNPLPHIDPFGTVILPLLCIISPMAFVFGYARPVPVNVARLGAPRRDMMLVAVAGPAANVLLCVVSALLLGLVPLVPDVMAVWMANTLQCSIILNAVLAVFNMLPVPPLDGGRIVTGLLPPALAVRYARLGRYGILLILAVLVLPSLVGDLLRLDLDFLWPLLLLPIEGLIGLVMALAGA